MARIPIPLAAALFATIAVHFGMLWSGFHDDDFIHLWRLDSSPVGAFLLRSHGGHVMVLPKLVMLALCALFGINPLPHMIVALALHLVNVALLFRIIVRFRGAPWAAGVVAMLWGTSPSHQAGLSWMATHGFVMGTTTTLLVINELARAMSEERKLHVVELVRINVLAVVGAASLGAAGSVALALPVIVWFLVPSRSSPWRAALATLPQLLVTVLVLSMVERFVPPSYDAVGISILFVFLLAFGTAAALAGPVVTTTVHGMGIEHAPVADTTPARLVLAVVVLALVLWRFARAGSGERRTSLGFLALSGAMYSAVAIGRAPFLRDVSASTIASWDRYHYAPTVGVAAAAALAISFWAPALVDSARRVAFWLASTALVVLVSAPIAFDHPSRETALWAVRHVALTDRAMSSVLGAQPAGLVYLRNDEFNPVLFTVKLEEDHSMFPGVGAYWAMTHGCVWGSWRLRFVDDDPKLAAALPSWTARVRDCFCSSQEALRARVRVHTLDETSPPELRDAFRSSVDPVLARAFAAALAPNHAH